MTDIDIRETADRVQALFAQNRAREAIQLLEQERRDEPRVVQEALDRYVAKGSETQLAALRRPGALSAEDAAVASTPLQRLQEATAMPRFPTKAEIETAELTEAQQYDMYASIVMTRGNDDAREDLGNGQNRVILGLRQENNTLDGATQDNPRTPRDESQLITQAGTGVYDDRLVVLWKDANGVGHVQVADKANTEPTAQYDHHAGSDGRRQLGDAAIETRQIAPSPGFENVTVRRKIEGEDVNNDNMNDLGRLRQGTVEMIEATHTNPRPSPNVPATRFALRPSPEAVTAGAGQVQRDTNGDGWFTQADVNGVQNLNATFKIHSGSKTNTDSAGCQTIHSADYAAFMGAVRGNATQDRWQYVLTETSPGRFRNIDAEAILPGNREVNPANPRQAAPDRAPQDPRQAPPERGGQNPRNPQQPGQPDQNERPGQAPPQMGPRRGGQAAIGPDDPNHQDYAKHEAIRIGVQKLGFQGEAADNMTAALLLSTKQVGGLNRIDDIKFNEANSKHAEGTFAIATYRPFGDKTPFFHARVDVAEATQQPTEKTFSQVESFNQQQAKQIALAEQQAQEKRQNPDGPSQQPPGGSTMKGPNIG